MQERGRKTVALVPGDACGGKSCCVQQLAGNTEHAVYAATTQDSGVEMCENIRRRWESLSKHQQILKNTLNLLQILTDWLLGYAANLVNCFKTPGMKWLYASLIFCIALPVCGARTVTDEQGHTITVSEHPHRLVCLTPNVVDDVFSLGAGADVVAVTDYVKYPPAARKKLSIGLPLSPSLETIIALHPDLVLGFDEMSNPDTVRRLRQIGIPVFMVTPHGLEGIYHSLASIGHALNRDEAARVLIGSLRAREAAVRRRVSGKPVVRILMPVWCDPIVTIGKRSFITEMIAIAGGRSVTSDLPQEWPQVSLEAMLSRPPDALLLVRGAKMSIDQVRGRPGWVNMPAIRNNRIYYVDERLMLSSPVAIDALEDMARQFHP